MYKCCELLFTFSVSKVIIANEFLRIDPLKEMNTLTSLLPHASVLHAYMRVKRLHTCINSA